MKRILSVPLLLVLVLVLSACAKPDYDKFVSGVEGHYRFVSIVNKGANGKSTYDIDIRFDSSSKTVYVDLQYLSGDQYPDAETLASEAHRNISDSAKKNHVKEYSSRIAVYSASGSKLYSIENGVPEPTAAPVPASNEDSYTAALRKYYGSFEVAPDDPMAGTWVIDPLGGTIIGCPDEFTYGDIAGIFVADGMFTFDGGVNMRKCYLSPDGSRLIVENGALGNVIYIRQE